MRFSRLFAPLLLAASLLYPLPTPARMIERGTFSFATGWAPVEGYLQTPAGGQPGTSDTKRPELDELGIDEAAYPDIEMRLRLGAVTAFYAGARMFQMEGEGDLEQDLLSRTLFQAGNSFEAEVEFNWYRLGMVYWLPVGQLVAVAPKVEVGMMDFSYTLGSAQTNIERSYAKATVRLGLEAEAHLTRRLRLQMHVASSLPLSNTPTIVNAGGKLAYDLIPGQLTAGLETVWLLIDYEDNQELPNHLRLETAPSLLASVQLKF